MQSTGEELCQNRVYVLVSQKGLKPNGPTAQILGITVEKKRFFSSNNLFSIMLSAQMI
jgi:hypothetical protein